MKMESVVVAAVAFLVPAAGAADRWEHGSDPSVSDDAAFQGLRNELRPGEHQTGHDLDPEGQGTDIDRFLVRTQLHHSYEVVVRGGTLYWGDGVGPSFCHGAGGENRCPRLDLVTGLDVVLASGTRDGTTNSYFPGLANALRLPMYGTGGTSFLRVRGDTSGHTNTAVDQYDIEFHDTTVAVPRFNNSGTQGTVLLVENTSDRAIRADADFLDATGALIATAGQDLAPFGMWALSTAGISALAGRSGSVLIRQDGPFGALAGKAVAVEPATGFTFDTPFVRFE